MNRRLICVLIGLQFIATTKAGSQAPKEAYYIFEDTSLQMNAVQALELLNKNAFILQSSNQFNPGFTKSVFWLAVKIDSTVNRDSIKLIIGQSVINKIEFYKVDRDQLPHILYKTGDHYPFKQRPFPTVDYSFPLSQSSTVYLLRIDKHNESLQLSFNTLSSTEFIASQIGNSLITGVLTGIIVLLLIFGLYLSIITGKKIYIFYILYITAGWLWVLSDLGYGFKYIWPDNTWFANRSRPVFCNLTIGFSLQYLVYYLGSIRTKILLKLLKVTSYFGLFIVGVWLLPLDVYDAAELSWVLLISIPLTVSIYILLSFITLLVEAKNRNIMALFYLGALVPLLLLACINLLNHSGLINISGTLLEHYGVGCGYVSEAIILTFGLVYRFNSYRIEKEKLHLAYEKQQRENAKSLIDTEAKERRRIADELHDIAGSMLSAAKLNITSIREKALLPDNEANEKLKKAEEALNIVAGSVRNLSHALSPIMLDKIGFRKAIQNIVGFFNSSRKIEIEVILIGFEKYEYQFENIYTTLYSILYELLNNIVKHSKASNAIIQIVEHEESITLTVEDNGTGFGKTFDKHNTRGLSGIISKINYFNGSIEFDSNEKGLIISIEIPKLVYAKDNSG